MSVYDVVLIPLLVFSIILFAVRANAHKNYITLGKIIARIIALFLVISYDTLESIMLALILFAASDLLYDLISYLSRKGLMEVSRRLEEFQRKYFAIIYKAPIAIVATDSATDIVTIANKQAVEMGINIGTRFSIENAKPGEIVQWGDCKAFFIELNNGLSTKLYMIFNLEDYYEKEEQEERKEMLTLF